MSAALELVSSFRRKGVRFAVEGDQLRYWAPTGSLSPTDMGSLRALKGEIISLLGEAAIHKPELRRVPRTGALLPSREQLGWWDGIRKGLYTQPYWLLLTSVVRWRGPLDTAALERALTTILARHEILRTRFVEVDGQLTMIVDDAEPVRTEVRDLTGLPPTERETAACTLATELCQRLFESLSVRLLRTHLLRLSEQDHVFVVVLHHILSDGQTVATLRYELQELYTAFASGRAPLLATPVFQYADYAAWQHSWMTPERQRAYLARLRNRVMGPLRFPADPTVAAVGNPTRLICSFVLPAELVTSIERFARAQCTTKHLVVLTALKIVLAEWVRQAQVTVANVGNLRIHEGLMDMLGPFMCLDLVSTDLADACSFREVLARVMKSYAESQDFRPYVPGSEYVPLVNVFVDYVRDFSAAAPRAAAARLTLAPSVTTEEFALLPVADQPMPQWTLIFLANEKAGSIEGSITVSSAQFSPQTVQRALDRFQSLLVDCGQHGDAAIRGIASQEHQTV
jgi:hypothetical protein